MRNLTDKQQVLIIALTPLMLCIDMLAVGVALPGIAMQFDAPLLHVQWMVTAFAIGYAGMMLAFARLGEIYGYRRMTIITLILFVVSSVIIGSSSTLWMAIIGRFFQGISGGAAIVLTMGFITSRFQGDACAKHMSTLSVFAGIGLAMGPVLGGFLSHFFGWRSIFFINVPIGIVTIILVSLYLPISHRQQRHIDIGGLLLICIALSAFALACSHGAQWGWTSPAILVTHCVWILSGMGFLMFEKRAEDPIFQATWLKSQSYSIFNGIGMILYIALISWIVLMSLYMHEELGLDSLSIAIHLVPCGLMGALANFIIPTLLKHISSRKLLLAGMSTGTLGMALMAIASINTNHWMVFGIALFGIGFFVTNPICLAESLREIAPAERASAISFAQMLRWVGAAVGTPALTALYAGLRLHMHPENALHSIFLLLTVVFAGGVSAVLKIKKPLVCL